MIDGMEEGYRTLDWIINKSEQGLYLVVADEKMQKEIVETYRCRAVEIYDCKQHPGGYSFRKLEEWVVSLPKTRTFMVVHFHLAVQDKESRKRLNFSRDMLERLGKNLIFFVTPYGDDRLAAGAYDFYSFVKLRVIFHEKIDEKEEEFLYMTDESTEENEWEAEELKSKMAETYVLVEEGKDKKKKACYHESEGLLLRAREIREKILGPEHLELAEIDSELAEVYESRGKYQVALEYFGKAYKAFLFSFGIEHPSTKAIYENMQRTYFALNPEGDFKQWMEKKNML